MRDVHILYIQGKRLTDTKTGTVKKPYQKTEAVSAYWTPESDCRGGGHQLGDLTFAERVKAYLSGTARLNAGGKNRAPGFKGMQVYTELTCESLISGRTVRAEVSGFITVALQCMSMKHSVVCALPGQKRVKVPETENVTGIVRTPASV